MMKAFHPQISVKLIKAFTRNEIIPGLPVSKDRYGNLDGIDLTSLLGDGSSVRTSKSVRQPFGTFNITLVDKPESRLMETVYALIEPMDMIEIRMSREALTKTGDQGQPKIVMRGFVSDVFREEAMAGDRPSRMVTISGHDFTKILHILQIMYFYNTMTGQALLSEFRFFETFANAKDTKYMTAGEFLTKITENVINPYMARIASLPRFDVEVKSMIPEVSIPGIIAPQTLNSYDNTSFYNMMRACLDVPTWNEMYVDDRGGDGVFLVARPLPMKSLDGKFIQGSADSIDISSDRVVAENVKRSDSGVANFFWVTNSRWTPILHMDQQDMMLAGKPEDFLATDYLNADIRYFGIRRMDADSTLGPPSYKNSDAMLKEDIPSQSQSYIAWLAERRKLFATINKDNVVHESGSLRLRGDETIKPGVYLNLLRGSTDIRMGEVYAHTVSHEFTPYRGFFTTVNFDRGTMFSNRAQQQKPRYIDEIESQGAR